MAYQAIIEARKAAEEKSESVRKAVALGLQMMQGQKPLQALTEARKAAEESSKYLREGARLGLQMKREEDEKRAAQRQAHEMPSADL
ncbi:hypothetical protein LAZ40_11385 [Cereibacter sphaeroides]|uniref:hypothetical protein n=1 Tax=Cereibacter sphaeroides TaxID=1063 RepID=UPI001F38EF1E|nr:hypothetical protein [Cereibacter sphaeroides]MCE6959629.1 hypothetical protein [Cereibacter sphaeroides]MCE6974510.1 hypothetical protein [Cereibacter sphaeroides]